MIVSISILSVRVRISFTLYEKIVEFFITEKIYKFNVLKFYVELIIGSCLKFNLIIFKLTYNQHSKLYTQ